MITLYSSDGSSNRLPEREALTALAKLGDRGWEACAVVVDQGGARIRWYLKKSKE